MFLKTWNETKNVCLGKVAFIQSVGLQLTFLTWFFHATVTKILHNIHRALADRVKHILDASQCAPSESLKLSFPNVPTFLRRWVPKGLVPSRSPQRKGFQSTSTCAQKSTKGFQRAQYLQDVRRRNENSGFHVSHVSAEVAACSTGLVVTARRCRQTSLCCSRSRCKVRLMVSGPDVTSGDEGLKSASRTVNMSRAEDDSP